MKLKLRGNGTALGTNVCSENNEELLGIEAFSLSLDATFLLPILKLTLSTVLFDIPSSSLNVAKNNRPNRSGFYLKLIGDGTSTGSKLVDTDTLETIDGLSNFKWFVHQKIGIITVEIEITDFIIDLRSNSGSSSSVLLHNAGSLVCPPPSVTISGSGSGGSPPDLLDDIDDLDIDLDDIVDANGNIIQCNHEWVNASFVGLKFVCKKCNANKPNVNP
jgi:hypothetical protein